MNIVGNHVGRIFYYIFVLLFVQIFVLDKVNVFYGYIVPAVYFYILLWVPFSVPRIWFLIFSFVLGYSMDVLHLSMGIHTFACVNVAFFRNSVYKKLAFLNHRDSVLEMNIASLGFPKYLLYLLIMTAIYFLSVTILEWFSINIFEYYFMVKWISDTAISIFLVVLIDFITLRFRKNAYF